jgi:hypothetical protein
MKFTANIKVILFYFFVSGVYMTVTSTDLPVADASVRSRISFLSTPPPSKHFDNWNADQNRKQKS